MEDHRVQSQAICHALTTVNAPLPRQIDAGTLSACLLLELTDKRWRPHVRAFFGEVAVAILMDMVVEGSVTFEDYAKAISFWGVDEDYENVRWVREMAAATMKEADEADELFTCDINIDGTGLFIGRVMYRSYETGRLNGSTEESIRLQFDQLCQLRACGAMVRDGIVLTGYHNRDGKGDVLLLDGEFIGTWHSDDFEWCFFMESGNDVETCTAPSPWMLHDTIAMWLDGKMESTS